MSPKTDRQGKLKALRDLKLGLYEEPFPKDSVIEKIYWPDDDDPNVIWTNQGMGNWDSWRLGIDVEIVK